MIKYSLFIASILFMSCQNAVNTKGIQKKNSKETLKPQTPIMGWSSWNDFHVNINEEIIKGQADFMVSSGMADAGYSYVNIDDGFFGGRDSEGNLLVHPERFPNGMKVISDYIHSKGLKAGIYSDAGINTCGS
jgi:alpha-galactosidase